MIENVKMNFKKKYKPYLDCDACNSNNKCNQFHLLYCLKLIESNQLITYIPDYEDIFNDNNTKEQCFIANIMMANLKKKKEIENI